MYPLELVFIPSIRHKLLSERCVCCHIPALCGKYGQ